MTLEVTTADAQKLTLASQVGQLSLALRQAANDKGENTERVTLSDLTGDTPADVARRQSDLDAKLAEAQKRQQEQLSTIRNDVQTVGSRLETRIGSLEERLKNEKNPIDPPPARLEKPHVVVKEVVKYVDPPKPKVVSVGVTRGLKRQVYEVPSVEDGQQIDLPERYRPPRPASRNELGATGQGSDAKRGTVRVKFMQVLRRPVPAMLMAASD